eukprot:4210434-Lingulodinium_polyedra.AAC.1
MELLGDGLTAVRDVAVVDSGRHRCKTWARPRHLLPTAQRLHAARKLRNTRRPASSNPAWQ